MELQDVAAWASGIDFAPFRSAGQIKAIVVPVGTVWQKFLSAHDKPMLHDRDGSHPTLAGTYLAACTFLAGLLKQSPTSIESGPVKLPPEDRALLQAAALKFTARR